MENAMRLYTKEQTAVYLQISTRTLDRYIKEGLIIPIRIGSQVRFPENVLSAISTTQS